jgi:Vitamin K-dependent gamma-carboxylase
MQDALNAVSRYGMNVARTVARDWNAFWYTPADPTLLGLLRIFTGLMLVYTHAVWGLALNDFFGPTSWLSPALVRSIEAGQYTYSFWFWVPSQWMWPAYALSMVIFVLFTLGLWTRLTSVLSLFTAISYAHRVPAALFGLDQINVMLTLYLSIGPSGQNLSLDRWLLMRRLGRNAPAPAPSASANLAQRLIQFHMCVIYLFAGLSKLQGPSWWSGEAMWRAFANLEYQSLDMTWLAWHPWLVNMMTHVSVVWEISFCVLIWKPLWRPVMLAGAVVMHVGIGLCLGMWTFGLIMLVGCASFLPNEWVRRIVSAIDKRRGTSAIELDRSPLKPKRGLARILPSDRRPAQPATAGGLRARS